MTKAGDDIIEGMTQALAHARGEDVPGIRVHKVDLADVDAKAIRKKMKMTQDQMAHTLGVSASGYRKWEQGQRHPNGAALTLLKIMDQEPDAVRRVVAA